MRRVRLDEARCDRMLPMRRSRAKAPLAEGAAGASAMSAWSGSAFIGPSSGGLARGEGASAFLEAIADAVERLDHFEVRIGDLELLAQPLDVAVDGAVVDIDLVVIGGVHERVAALHHAGTLRQRLQDQELGHRERDGLALPGAGVAL